MSHADEIREARAALAESAQPCGCDKGAHWTCEQHRVEPRRDVEALMRRANALAASPALTRPADRREPLDDASYAVQQAVADFYVLLRKAEQHAEVMKIWNRLGELEELVSACASAAGRKADTL